MCSRCQWNDTALGVTRNAEDTDHVSLGEISSEIEVEATLEFYRDNSYPIEQSQCQSIIVAPSDGISTVRTSVLPNTRCPIPYYIGELPGDKDSESSSAGHRSRGHPATSLHLICAWLWLMTSYYFLSCPMDVLAVVAEWVSSYRKCSTSDEKMNRRCWLISWRWWCSLSDLLLLSSSITTCCWRTELFRRGPRTPTKPVRTLKCQLLMFWKLYLIRNYLRIPRHPRCRRRGRDLTPLTRNAAQPQTPPPPSPTLMPTISSQSSLKDTPLGECQSRTRSGPTSNSNAKTVVRWGTTIGVVVVVVAARILLLLRRRRRLLQRTYYYCIRITNCLCARWSLWSPEAAAADKVTDRRSTWSRIVQGTLEFGSLKISRIVWTGEWLICRIEQSKLSAYLFHEGAFGQRMRGRGTQGRSEGAGIREGNRLGLITMIET